MFREFNYKLIFRIMGGLLLFKSVILLTTIFIALYYDEHVVTHFLITSVIALVFGMCFFIFGRNASPVIGKREGSVIVTGIWVVFSFIGFLPFWLSGSIPSFTDAFFETMSGYTTTGASILNDIESLPKSMLYWRSLTQWIGGLGIIVISIALLPIFGFTSVQLFSAEATGPTKDKIHPKISETAKRLLGIYVVLTIAEMLLLTLAGMGWFDALNHSFTTMATGGFSTKQASVGHWDSPLIQYIIILFMFFAGVNFTLFYFILKGKMARLKDNEEFRVFLIVSLIFTFLIALTMIPDMNGFSLYEIEKVFRDSLFTVVSIITTTGYGTFDYMLLKPAVWLLILVLMLIGASAGSTAGGMKLVRVILTFKYAYYEFKRIIHPNAVFPVKYNRNLVREEVINRVLSFIMLYFIIIFIGAIILAFSGMGFMESISGMITCLSDVGPGLGTIGPAGNFAHLPDFSKWFLSFVMLVGRLELFTVLVIFTPIFWRR
jgi:trk system potassium uptake protein